MQSDYVLRFTADLRQHPFLPKLSVILLMGVVAYVDYITGSEVRVYPLYFVPIGLAALFTTRRIALFTAFISAILWLISNILSGTEYNHPFVWAWNVAVQWGAFAFIAYLICDIKTAKDKHEKMARIDDLTQLPNTRAFHDHAPSRISWCKRMSLPITIAYIDLDHFKNVNDTYGHNYGDDVLRTIALIIKSHTRESDLLSRVGGDEFVILLPNTSHSSAMVVLERIRKEIEQTMQLKGYDVTASIGAATFEAIPKHLEEMMHIADSVMYGVKSVGKNCVVVTQATCAA